jgi:two-component system response regulator RstA
VKNVLVIGTTGEARILAGALGDLGFYSSMAFGLEAGVERVIDEKPDAVALEMAEPTSALLTQARLLAGWTKVILLSSRGDPSDLNNPDLPAVFWPDDPTVAAAQIGFLLDATPEGSGDVLRSLTEPLVRGDLRIDPRSMQAYIEKRTVDLTTAEFRLLHALALANGTPVHRSELSRRAGVADTRVIDVMVGRIRRKLEAVGASQDYVGTRVKQGYYFSSEPKNV